MYNNYYYNSFLNIIIIETALQQIIILISIVCLGMV